ncbi:MAG: ABC transporter ATP-binding protein [candidate division WOR-3 bacterium]
MSEILLAEGIHKTYYLKNEVIHVLRGVDLVVKRGSFVVIYGPSGSGKSTLLNILGSLDKPTSGRVIFDSCVLFNHSDAELSQIRNKKIGFVFQFHYLLPEFTALENIALPALLNGTPKRDAYKKAAELLEVLGMADKRTRRPDELSGGERQRVAIARALINEPILILADEPSGNLDEENKNKLMDVFIDLKNKDRAIVLVTHSLDIAKLGTEVYNLKEGRLHVM